MQVLRSCVSSGFRFGNLFAGSTANAVFNAFGHQRNLCSLMSAKTPNGVSGPSSLLEVPSLLTTIVRTTTRNHFPKPRETKRIRGHGLKKRLKTAGGRWIIINRIIKDKNQDCRKEFQLHIDY
ncbi:unnamed protein product [Allacma fusca]|uniref:Uncharacterized protein n=1 Tax=Allacma fusca TaxID=39272 RepID=A0A8J2Q4Q9_9HEXA|nr:unnamed protein product [Allacma fusca]